jgi:hypothetical protein
MTTPVITEGFVVVFALSDGTKRRVHVAGSKAIVCDRGGIPNVPRIALPARDVGSVSEKAREDLAQRLGVPPEDIQVVKLSRVQWADSAMDCAVPGEAIDPSPVSGYLLQLRYNDREFTYHADSERVRACPPIESR